MTVVGALAVGALTGLVLLAAAFEVCNQSERFEGNLFHIGDA